ncbi:hypothetical protein ETD86_12970 [Nonomuraea turkmeniaca]|uniref:Uncharacterized protein n=1 Tax=Nonomuraea turkmeniaca TaxID=103838 RepID=A0A5S4FNQ1_9ACTN|nr:hypothetical protein [Nonomuraea turkmeniaca]TMR22074.1 hypothetical protein ETD86_12970 [Nonomuraea turkmeniaca]
MTHAHPTPPRDILEVTKWTYESLLSTMPITVLHQAEDGDNRSGDRFSLVRHHDGRFGLLIFGWASCSRCDALQACKTPADFAELHEQVFSGIHWEATAADLLAYLDHKDIRLDWWGHQPLGPRFRAEAAAYLTRLIVETP